MHIILSQLISSKKIIGSKVAVNNPREVADLLMEEMRYLDREQFRILMLTTKNTIIGCETISIGGLHSSLVHPREVFKLPLKKSAFSLILLHNHPSGNPQPSQQDIAVTLQLIEAGKLMGIGILDHIVFGDGTYVSLKQDGLI